MPGFQNSKVGTNSRLSSRFFLFCAVIVVWTATAKAQEAPLEALPRPLGGEGVRTLKSEGPPQTHLPGRIAVGDILISAPVRHALTGVLQWDVLRMDGLSGRRMAVPAGTEVFGMRTSMAVRQPSTEWARQHGVPGTVLPLNDQTIWCLVQPPRGADGKTICLPIMGGIYRWVEAGPGLYPSEISATNKSPMVSGILVAPAPVERLPTMLRTVGFGGWTADSLLIDTTINGAGPTPIVLRRSLPRKADGSVILRTHGGRLLLKPVAEAPDSAELSILTAPSPSATP